MRKQVHSSAFHRHSAINRKKVSNLQLTLSNKQTTKLEVSTRYSNCYDVIRVISTGICKVLLLLNDHRTPFLLQNLRSHKINNQLVRFEEIPGQLLFQKNDLQSGIRDFRRTGAGKRDSGLQR